MSHDIDERRDGLDDALRERLNRLGRSATADSLPWPGVDRAIHRRRRTSALRTGAAALAVVAVAGAAAVAIPRLQSGPVTPAGTTVATSYVPPPPWKVPTAGFVPLYENVRVRLDVSACRRVASINLREPAKVATADYSPDRAAPGDLWVVRPCDENDDIMSLDMALPTMRMWSDGRGVPTPDECVGDIRGQTYAAKAGLGYGGFTRVAPGGWTGNQCAILPADPATGKPGALVAFSATSAGDGFVDVTASAWTGTHEVALAPRRLPTAGPTVPGQQAYRDVPLRLPGKPEACAAGNETYLNLHVPEVNRSLGLSDAALTPPCPDPAAANLQLGAEPRGVVLQKADASAADCEAALEQGTKVDTFKPVEGTTLCIVSPVLAEYNLPGLLVALTVTKVNAETGAFDLSATGWVR
jgi:hypothetical protein